MLYHSEQPADLNYAFLSIQLERLTWSKSGAEATLLTLLRRGLPRSFAGRSGLIAGLSAAFERARAALRVVELALARAFREKAKTSDFLGR